MVTYRPMDRMFFTFSCITLIDVYNTCHEIKHFFYLKYTCINLKLHFMTLSLCYINIKTFPKNTYTRVTPTRKFAHTHTRKTPAHIPIF